MSKHKIIAIIVAGGRGTRAKMSVPKQYLPLAGVPMLRRTALAFTRHPMIDATQIVIGAKDRHHYDTAIGGLSGVLPPITGGDTRQSSVANGLIAAKKAGASHVLIHDGARPFVSQKTITSVIEMLNSAEGAIAALPVGDTLKRENTAGGIESTVSRDGLWRAQTPQGFRLDTIIHAHEVSIDGNVTDDAALLEALGIHVALIPDVLSNMKLTYKEDFSLAETLLAGAREERVGLGVDVHAFEPGDRVILGGITIPHTHKLKGHSDADVVLHAITDALYGAIAAGDIGEHFPPSDEQWRGASSEVFLDHAAKMVAEREGVIRHIDVTIMCEAPKIGPHREAMRTRIAEILQVAIDRVAVKATTTEKLGFTGRKEGIMAQAVASISLPSTR